MTPVERMVEEAAKAIAASGAECTTTRVPCISTPPFCYCIRQASAALESLGIPLETLASMKDGGAVAVEASSTISIPIEGSVK